MAKAPTKRGRGRPYKVLDEKKIEALAAIGCTVAEIAVLMECGKRTLERNYDALIKRGRERMKESLRRMQYKSAHAGNVTMQIWLGKNHLGQSDRQAVDHTTGGRPIKVLLNVDAEKV